MTRILPRAVKIAFALALAVLALNVVHTWRDIRGLQAHTSQIAHARELIAALRCTLSTLKDAEAGARGFLLTGDRADLRPYEDSAVRLGKAFETLGTLSRADSVQSARVERLRTLANDRMDNLAATLERVKCDGPCPALGVRLTQTGTSALDQARELAAAIDEDERRVVAGRSAAYHSAIERTIASSAITTGTAIVLLVAVAGLARHVALATSDGDAAGRSTRRRPPPELRRAATRAATPPTARKPTLVDTPIGVLGAIVLAILALCAVLLVVSRF